MNIRKTALALLLGAVAPLAQAALPAAVVKDGVPAADAVGRLNDGEITAGVWLRFDALPSAGNPVDFFGVTADAEGVLAVTIPSARGDLIGDMTFRTKTAVEKGAWHFLSFEFSRQQRRFALYLDGRLQFENDMQWLCRVDVGRVKASPRAEGGFLGLGGNGGFRGEAKGLVLYDASLSDRYVRPAERLAEDAAKAKALVQPALASKNADLAAWAKRLDAAADAALAEADRTVEQTMVELVRDAANVARIYAENGDRPGVGAVMTTDLLSQEMVLPYFMPDKGVFSGQVPVTCACDESESASVLVFAYRPLHGVTLRLSDLRTKDGLVYRADTVDMKLVKRVYQTGGAWMTYHRDPRLRILTPNLLLNDDTLFRVDEFRRRNYMRIDYPKEQGGSAYADISDPDAPVESFRAGVPHNDAERLLPLDIPETGRNQQFALCFRAGKDAKPGLYQGTLDIVAREGAVAKLAVSLRILPFVLPQPRSYDNLDEPYISCVNHLNPSAFPPSAAGRVKLFTDMARNCLEHNAQQTDGIWNSPDRAAIAKSLGFDTTYILWAESIDYCAKYLGCQGRGDWRDLYGSMLRLPEYQDALAKLPEDPIPYREGACGKLRHLLGDAERQKAFAFMKRAMRPFLEHIRGIDPKAMPILQFWSETGAYVRLADIQRQEAQFAHALGFRVSANGGKHNCWWAADVQDNNSQASNMSRDIADRWHAAGGTVMSYCMPFPSSENPAMHRRWNGLWRYKTFRYDGSMQHGLITRQYDEFRDDPGGDGNYRNFCVGYPQQKGITWTLGWEGWREAYDDVRYATLLKQLCTPYLNDPDDYLLRGEAKRCLLWLADVDDTYGDMNAFRAGAQLRILNFRKALANSGKKGSGIRD